jgi:hypothetical protein
LLTHMEVVSAQPDAPALPLGGFMPNVQPVQIRNIDGLGPVKSEIATTPFATGRGELFQGASTGKRNILLNFGLSPNWVDQTIASLRKLLYAYFMPEQWVTCRFFSDDLPTVFIKGIIESFDPNIFSQDPEIQVSILCPKPDFIDESTTLVEGVVDGTETTISYAGNAPTGFQLRIKSASALPSYTGDLTIKNTVRGEDQIFKIQNVTVDTTKYVELNTVKSSRYVYNIAVSDDSAIDILAKVGINPVWPELSPGENKISVTASTPGLAWALAYFKRFGGL